MIFREERGNLFQLDNKYTLAQCISEDCEMGAGIAVEFQKRFKMRNCILKTLHDYNLHFPCSIIYINNNKKALNIITKKKYWNKPTYLSLEKALEDAAKVCVLHDIHY